MRGRRLADDRQVRRDRLGVQVRRGQALALRCGRPCGCAGSLGGSCGTGRACGSPCRTVRLRRGAGARLRRGGLGGGAGAQRADLRVEPADQGQSGQAQRGGDDGDAPRHRAEDDESGAHERRECEADDREAADRQHGAQTTDATTGLDGESRGARGGPPRISAGRRRLRAGLAGTAGGLRAAGGAGRSLRSGLGQPGPDVRGEVAGHALGGGGDATRSGPVGRGHGGVHRVGSGGTGVRQVHIHSGQGGEAGGTGGGTVVCAGLVRRARGGRRAQVQHRCGANCQGQFEREILCVRVRGDRVRPDPVLRLRGLLCEAVHDLESGPRRAQAQAGRGRVDGDRGRGEFDAGGVGLVAQQLRARGVDGAALRALDVDRPHACRLRVLILLRAALQHCGHDDDEQHCCDQQEGDARVHNPTLESGRCSPPDHGTRVSIRSRNAQAGGPGSGSPPRSPCSRVWKCRRPKGTSSLSRLKIRWSRQSPSMCM